MFSISFARDVFFSFQYSAMIAMSSKASLAVPQGGTIDVTQVLWHCSLEAMLKVLGSWMFAVGPLSADFLSANEF